MRDRFERALSIVITLCAVVVAGAVVYRTTVPAPGASRPRSPEFISSWTEALPIGTRLGSESASVVIVDVADLQCPVCRSFYGTVRELLEEYPGELAVVHVSYPLSYHEFAMPAAKAAECAAARGKFGEWIHAVYSKQDSLGKKSWGSFALDAGISDSAALTRCASDTASVARIAAGIAFGESIGLTGTPTVLVNGWKLSDPPTKEYLRSAVDSLLSGKNPFERKRFFAR